MTPCFGVHFTCFWGSLHKLHIGVTDDGNIIAGEVATLRDSDIATVPNLKRNIF